MQKQQWLGLFLLAAAAAAVIGATQFTAAPTSGKAEADEPLIESVPSPDGALTVRLLDGADEAVPSPETVQVADAATDDILWQREDVEETSALWSPEGGYVALSHRSRACGGVTVVETDSFSTWELPLPADAPSAEYALLSAVQWLDEDTLRVRCQNTQASSAESEPTFYRCYPRMENGQLTGSAAQEAPLMRWDGYDFDHDGIPETTELLALLDAGTETGAYALRIQRSDGAVLWSADAHLSHPGWTGVYACRVDGQDWLLQYEPEMWQGWADYSYRLFSPAIVSPANMEPKEQLLRSSEVVWDWNFHMDGHHFSAADLADFLWEVREYTAESTLLLSTEEGELLYNVPGQALQASPFGDLSALQSREKIEAALTQQAQAIEQP